MEKLWKTALVLAIVTVLYNIAEGVVSVIFGYSDDTLSLLGFGLDSFVEVVSGAGIIAMVLRIRNNRENRDAFEKTALRVTGFSFYLLCFGLCLTSAINIFTKSVPETTVWGIVISLVSICTMLMLFVAKMRIGRKLNSQAIISDANCTKTCIYLSIVLLASSVAFEFLKIGFIDAVGALGIAWFAFREGREAFEKPEGKTCGCRDDDQKKS